MLELGLLIQNRSSDILSNILTCDHSKYCVYNGQLDLLWYIRLKYSMSYSKCSKTLLSMQLNKADDGLQYVVVVFSDHTRLLFDPIVKVKGQIMYYLENESPPKPLDVALQTLYLNWSHNVEGTGQHISEIQGSQQVSIRGYG